MLEMLQTNDDGVPTRKMARRVRKQAASPVSFLSLLHFVSTTHSPKLLWACSQRHDLDPDLCSLGLSFVFSPFLSREQTVFITAKTITFRKSERSNGSMPPKSVAKPPSALPPVKLAVPAKKNSISGASAPAKPLTPRGASSAAAVKKPVATAAAIPAAPAKKAAAAAAPSLTPKQAAIARLQRLGRGLACRVSTGRRRVEKLVAASAPKELSLRQFPDIFLSDRSRYSVDDPQLWPLIIDATEQVEVFLRYQSVHILHQLSRSDMEPESIRMAVLNSLRHGKPLVLVLDDAPSMDIAKTAFAAVAPTLWGDVMSKAIREEAVFEPLIRKSDGEQYEIVRFTPSNMRAFVFVVLTTAQKVKYELRKQFSSFLVVKPQS